MAAGGRCFRLGIGAHHMSGILRSIGAVLAGIVAVVVLSVATDAVLEQSLFPGLAKGEATLQVWLIVTAYRCFYSVVGGYIAAWLSPSRPALHAIILGGIGLVLGL